MATLAALGKACARPAISAAIWTQDQFFVRKTQLSWSPRLYFLDRQGQTLAFLRNTVITPTQGLRVFSDPTLSFELLGIKRALHRGSASIFEVHDPLNREAVGTIRPAAHGRLQRRHWMLISAAGQEVADIAEDSLFVAGMRRVLMGFVPQTYTFMHADHQLGHVQQKPRFFSPEIEVDLSGDGEKRLDRRLVVAAVIVLMAEPLQDPHRLS